MGICYYISRFILITIIKSIYNIFTILYHSEFPKNIFILYMKKKIYCDTLIGGVRTYIRGIKKISKIRKITHNSHDRTRFGVRVPKVLFIF